MTHHNDTRLSDRAYRQALEGVETQFALIRYALGALSKNAIKGFFKGRLHNQLGNIDAAFAEIKGGAQAEEIAKLHRTREMLRDIAKKEHRKESKTSDNRFKIELSEDRLNQSELLLLVAHFESFMKEVHLAFLTAAPAKVFSKRDTSFMLREAFQDGSGGCFTKFLKELITKEVKSLDSQRVDRRADYFAKNFQVSFGSEAEIKHLKEILDTRNKISHEIYLAPAHTLEDVRDQPLVSDEMLNRARQLFRQIPRRCVEAGAKDYQSYFQK